MHNVHSELSVYCCGIKVLPLIALDQEYMEVNIVFYDRMIRSILGIKVMTLAAI